MKICEEPESVRELRRAVQQAKLVLSSQKSLQLPNETHHGYEESFCAKFQSAGRWGTKLADDSGEI